MPAGAQAELPGRGGHSTAPGSKAQPELLRVSQPGAGNVMRHRGAVGHRDASKILIISSGQCQDASREKAGLISLTLRAAAPNTPLLLQEHPPSLAVFKTWHLRCGLVGMGVLGRRLELAASPSLAWKCHVSSSCSRELCVPGLVLQTSGRPLFVCFSTSHTFRHFCWGCSGEAAVLRAPQEASLARANLGLLWEGSRQE